MIAEDERSNLLCLRRKERKARMADILAGIEYGDVHISTIKRVRGE